MRASEIRKLIGKTVKFKSNKTYSWNPQYIATGKITDVVRFEVNIAGDWHDTRTLEIIEAIE